MTTETDAFRALYDAHHAQVLRLLSRMVGPQDAEDLTQIVFLKAANALADFRGDAQASTWLYRIATNVASDWLRGRTAHEAKVTVALPDPPDREASGSAAIAPDDRTPEQALARKEIADCLRAEIGQLPESHREILMLSVLGGLTDDELAETLGLTLGNARVKLHRARAELKKVVGSRCDFYRTELGCEPSSTACCTPASAAAPSR